MKRTFVFATGLLAIALLVAACKPKTDSTGKPAGEVVKSVKVENLTVTLLTTNGQLKQGDQELTLAFSDPLGKSVDVGAVSLNFHMPAMGGMAAMNDGVTFTTTDTPGVYRGKVNIGMAGEWQAQLAYEGPAGKGKTTFSVTAR
ncbi:MAG: FixH family protein [Pyrinomonadaceae bacterium]